MLSSSIFHGLVDDCFGGRSMNTPTVFINKPICFFFLFFFNSLIHERDYVGLAYACNQ